MKEYKFKPSIEMTFNEMSDEQKKEYKCKQEKVSKFPIVLVIVLIVIGVALLVAGIVMCVQGEYSIIIVALIFSVLIALIAQWAIRSAINELNASDEIKVKLYIQRLETQKEIKIREEYKQLQKNVNYRLSVDKIKAVTVLDAYTEVTDKLHAVLNYQEIIQTRVYKFKVDYIDGTSKVITANENSEEYNVLITRVTNPANEDKPSTNNIEKLREYKKLLDEGIITQEEFEAKKKELL